MSPGPTVPPPGATDPVPDVPVDSPVQLTPPKSDEPESDKEAPERVLVPLLVLVDPVPVRLVPVAFFVPVLESCALAVPCTERVKANKKDRQALSRSLGIPLFPCNRNAKFPRLNYKKY